MRKIALGLLFVLGFASFAFGNFEKNFKQGIKELTGVDVEVQVKKQLKSFNGEYFVIGRTSGGDIFPVIVSQDGKHFIGLSSVMNFSKEDSKMITEEINKAGEAKMKADAEGLKKLFSSFKESDFVVLKGERKNLPTKIVVTDPDCPYCRKHLEGIEAQLKEANLKLIFAPVHEEEAFIKAQLILNESAKVKDNVKKIAILRKYYKDIKLSDKEKKIDIKQVRFTTEKIFGSGLITGVPFIFEMK
ncbi:thiol peroxidase [Helicobacter winghamensis]|uniref:Thiol peroxidase n=1 Tax=Helicobacter winghamensis TaxID=157268 RepID=A0A2N3PH67_9HELI|nr:thiol peroxidase [Helicobacter winghamensis]PKT79083.1 thiol peroxidase [Helicobacter winghamensis]PKT79748.1 thiol peroxidase [Helicobacter winghamensis]PKT79830.1 thiol peroxidase [Helicobacter winghamensis]